MKDWNVVVTTYADGYRWARRFLQQFGTVAEAAEADAKVENSISRMAPCTETFDFSTPEDFETKASDIVVGWRSALAGKSFYVRMHRRGFRKQLPSQDEERLLDGALRAALKADGTVGRISFDDPDAIIEVETVDARAGVSLWTREELARFTFLNID